MKQEKFLTLPNIITLVRLLLAPVLAWVILENDKVLAVIVFGIILATDFFDGYLARKLNQESHTGVIFDATTDAIIMTSAIIALYLTNKFPLSWMTAIFALALLGFAFQLIAKLRKKDPLYKSLPVAKISAGALYILLVMFLLNIPMTYVILMFIIVLILTIVRVCVYFKRML